MVNNEYKRTKIKRRRSGNWRTVVAVNDRDAADKLAENEVGVRQVSVDYCRR